MKIVKQISVFLENKTGRINELTKILADNDINISAFTTSDGTEFGLMRLIVAQVDEAAKLLRANGFGVNVSEVIHIEIDNRSGALHKILSTLSAENIFIDYMYAFSDGATANTIIRTNDLERTIKILSR